MSYSVDTSQIQVIWVLVDSSGNTGGDGPFTSFEDGVQQIAAFNDPESPDYNVGGAPWALVPVYQVNA